MVHLIHNFTTDIKYNLQNNDKLIQHNLNNDKVLRIYLYWSFYIGIFIFIIKNFIQI